VACDRGAWGLGVLPDGGPIILGSDATTLLCIVSGELIEAAVRDRGFVEARSLLTRAP